MARKKSIWMFGVVGGLLMGYSLHSSSLSNLADAADNLADATTGKYAEPERQTIARGHYSRARALLVEALAEFEAGRRVARPDVILDPEVWRLSIISRAEDLNRVLDPAPRVTKAGVQYRAHKSLIRRESTSSGPEYKDGPREANTYGEEERAAAVQRNIEFDIFGPDDQMLPPSAPPAGLLLEEEEEEIEESAAILTPEADTFVEPETLETEILEAEELELPAEVTEAIEEAVPTENAAVNNSEIITEPAENSEITKAIEDAIKSRLDKMQSQDAEYADEVREVFEDEE